MIARRTRRERVTHLATAHGDPQIVRRSARSWLESRRVSRRADSGAVLILALIFIVAVSLVVAALADGAMNDLNNTSQFSAASQLRYALGGATNAAIYTVRYNPSPANPTLAEYAGSPTPVAPCWSSGPTTSPINGYTVAVYCTTVINLTKSQTRTVTFYACQWTAGLSANSCATSPQLTAVVAFDDYPSGGAPLLTTQCNLVVPAPTTCGSGQTLESWTWS